MEATAARIKYTCETTHAPTLCQEDNSGSNSSMLAHNTHLMG